jgi:hypothetical protein
MTTTISLHPYSIPTQLQTRYRILAPIKVVFFHFGDLILYEVQDLDAFERR